MRDLLSAPLCAILSHPTSPRPTGATPTLTAPQKALQEAVATMRDLRKLTTAPYHELLDNLVDNRLDAEELINEIAFLKQQELQYKKDTWTNMPGEGVQMRDRAALYAVADTQVEIIRLEGELTVNGLEHEILVRLIDAAR